MKHISEKEIKWYMTTGISRQEAIEEIQYWQKVSAILLKNKKSSKGTV